MAHILVIDDEQAIAAAIHQILEQAGHQVLVAPNGRIAMKMCDLHPVDLVITDIWMPEQDGLETIIQLRRQPTGPKILAMSGGGRYGLIEFLKMAQQFGADRTLHKPFSAGAFKYGARTARRLNLFVLALARPADAGVLHERFAVALPFLAIDGGGIKGMFPASFLATIEDTLGDRVAKYFDLIVGTSTGGIIALGLGLGFSAQELASFYEELGTKVFPGNSVLRSLRQLLFAKYSDKPLREALEAKFGQRKLGESSTRLVIPALNLET